MGELLFELGDRIIAGQGDAGGASSPAGSSGERLAVVCRPRQIRRQLIQVAGCLLRRLRDRMLHRYRKREAEQSAS